MQLWDYLVDLWMYIKEEQLGSMWRDFSVTSPARMLQVILKAVLQAKPDQDIIQGVGMS